MFNRNGINIFDFDLYSKRISFFFEKRDKIGTVFGLLLTFIYIILTLVYIIYKNFSSKNLILIMILFYLPLQQNFFLVIIFSSSIEAADNLIDILFSSVFFHSL